MLTALWHEIQMEMKKPILWTTPVRRNLQDLTGLLKRRQRHGPPDATTCSKALTNLLT